MTFNGSGTFNRPVSDYVFDTVISETDMNTEMDGIATGLSTCIAKDGQTTVTANLPMNSKKHTEVAAGTALTDYADVKSAQNGTYIWCGTAGGTADAITLTPSPTITAYVTGQEFRWKASANASTGAATVAISGLTTKALEIGDSALKVGQHQANRYYKGIYDGAALQIEIFSTQAGNGGDITFVKGDPKINGNDTDGVLTISGNSTVLGGIIKAYGDTHATKPSWIEFIEDTNVIGTWDATASAWLLNPIVVNTINGSSASNVLTIYGDPTAQTGGGIKLIAGGHADANDVVFLSDTTVVAKWDDSETTWDFNSKDIKGVGQLIATGFTGTLDGALGSGTPSTVVCTTFTSTGIDDNATSVAMTINSVENIIVNHTAGVGIGGLAGTQVQHQVHGTLGTQSLTRWSTGALGPRLLLGKSRGALGTLGTVVQDNNVLGSIIFCGDDGTDLATAGASIFARVQGTPGSDDMPAELVFAVNAGAATVTERMTLFATGGVTLGTPTDGDKGAGTLNATAVYDDGTILTGDHVFDMAEDGDVDIAKYDALVPDKVEPGQRECQVERMEDHQVEVEKIEIVDGKAVRTKSIERRQEGVFTELPMVDGDGKPVMVMIEPAVEAVAAVKERKQKTTTVMQDVVDIVEVDGVYKEIATTKEVEVGLTEDNLLFNEDGTPKMVEVVPAVEAIEAIEVVDALPAHLAEDGKTIIPAVEGRAAVEAVEVKPPVMAQAIHTVPILGPEEIVAPAVKAKPAVMEQVMYREPVMDTVPEVLGERTVRQNEMLRRFTARDDLDLDKFAAGWKRDRHLPGFPSAAEMANGERLAVGDLVMRSFKPRR